MKYTFAIIMICIAGLWANDASAAKVMPIPQVDRDSEPSDSAAIFPMSNDSAPSPSPSSGGDYQADVLSNTGISDAARAQAAIHASGGNVAIISQKGADNVSKVIQSGDKNTAVQSQVGVNNDLRLEQSGDDNESTESQIGDNNSKIKIQRSNGMKKVTIEQVQPN